MNSEHAAVEVKFVGSDFCNWNRVVCIYTYKYMESFTEVGISKTGELTEAAVHDQLDSTIYALIHAV